MEEDRSNEAVWLHSAGATVIHKSPFDELVSSDVMQVLCVEQ